MWYHCCTSLCCEGVLLVWGVCLVIPTYCRYMCMWTCFIKLLHVFCAPLCGSSSRAVGPPNMYMYDCWLLDVALVTVAMSLLYFQFLQQVL